MKLGPQSSTNHEISESLRIHMQNCESYISSKLSSFDRYIIWRYTIGSGSVNSFLITNKIQNNSVYWTYLFFQYWNNTVRKLSDLNGSDFYDYDLPDDFGIFFEYFKNPDSYLKSEINKEIIAQQVIILYISNLQRIILGSPEVLGDGFDIYKVSSKYPGLPESDNFSKREIKQLPFNSTTFYEEFNFAPFISPSADSVLFVIHIPKGSRILYISDLYHAYAFERELILPKDCTFDIFNYKVGVLNYIDPSSVNVNLLQSRNNISMGSVYEINESLPCGKSVCKISTRDFDILECNYIPPKN